MLKPRYMGKQNRVRPQGCRKMILSEPECLWSQISPWSCLIRKEMLRQSSLPALREGYTATCRGHPITSDVISPGFSCLD